MTLTRRRLLEGATALTVAALTAGIAAPAHVVSAPLPEATVGGMRDVLVMHDGGAAAVALTRQVRTSVETAHVSDKAVSVLTLGGFRHAGALLEGSSGNTLVVLLDDAETLVVEALLRARGVAVLTHRRHGPQVLLTARL